MHHFLGINVSSLKLLVHLSLKSSCEISLPRHSWGILFGFCQPAFSTYDLTKVPAFCLSQTLSLPLLSTPLPNTFQPSAGSIALVRYTIQPLGLQALGVTHNFRESTISNRSPVLRLQSPTRGFLKVCCPWPRLRIGYTHLTHSHLSRGEKEPWCDVTLIGSFSQCSAYLLLVRGTWSCSVTWESVVISSLPLEMTSRLWRGRFIRERGWSLTAFSWFSSSYIYTFY